MQIEALGYTHECEFTSCKMQLITYIQLPYELLQYFKLQGNLYDSSSFCTPLTSFKNGTAAFYVMPKQILVKC